MSSISQIRPLFQLQKAMQKPTASSLIPPRQYAAMRPRIRNEYIKHRRSRALDIGPMMRLQFEDATTLLYQVQEVLHAQGAQTLIRANAELEQYRALFPQAGSLAATLFIEISPGQSEQFQLLNDAVRDLYLTIKSSNERSYAYVNADLGMSDWHCVSAVHFVRFALSPTQIMAVKNRASLEVGSAHNLYCWKDTLSPELGIALAGEL
jgi:Protein of unknown function (DUF3501)